MAREAGERSLGVRITVTRTETGTVDGRPEDRPSNDSDEMGVDYDSRAADPSASYIISTSDALNQIAA